MIKKKSTKSISAIGLKRIIYPNRKTKTEKLRRDNEASVAMSMNIKMKNASSTTYRLKHTTNEHGIQINEVTTGRSIIKSNKNPSKTQGNSLILTVKLCRTEKSKEDNEGDSLSLNLENIMNLATSKKHYCTRSALENPIIQGGIYLDPRLRSHPSHLLWELGSRRATVQVQVGDSDEDLDSLLMPTTGFDFSFSTIAVRRSLTLTNEHLGIRMTIFRRTTNCKTCNFSRYSQSALLFYECICSWNVLLSIKSSWSLVNLFSRSSVSNL